MPRFNSDSDFIQAVLKDESWRKSFYWVTNKKPEDAKFYVKEGQVRSDFINREGKPMYFYFYFCAPPEFNPYLICGTKFI